MQAKASSNARDPSLQRLFIDHPLSVGQDMSLSREHANYLLNVLRLKAHSPVLVFNGRDGEWRAELAIDGRKSARLVPVEQVQPQPAPHDLDYLFAPLKSARLDYMAQKAVEMGVGRLIPVITRRTQVSRVNLERLQANAIEAAEQCGLLQLPQVLPELTLQGALATHLVGRMLVFCDEDAPVADPVAALREIRPDPVSLLIGPEGGFDADERVLILALPNVVRISLGPRILRADTAAVAALAAIQVARGDWRSL
jgi:16S rRNA (uracil1498-N3)-methyltransferase